MSTTIEISQAQIETLADKLDSLDLTPEEQAALVAVFGAGDRPDDSKPVSGDWQLPSPGEGLRNAFSAGAANEVSGYAARSVDVSVSVGWSALN